MAAFAGSEHRNVSDTFYDPQIALNHNSQSSASGGKAVAAIFEDARPFMNNPA
jgi:hypothetical protein